MYQGTYTIPWSPLTNAPSTTSVIRDSDSATIPTDPGNTDFTRFLAWLAAGNTATLSPAPPKPAPSIGSFLQLMALFTQSELVAMAASADPQVRINIWQALSAAPGGIAATNPAFLGWVAYLQTVGILTQLRAVLVGSLIPPQ